MDSRIRALYPKAAPIVGYATTATFRSAHRAPEGDAYAGIPDQVARFTAEVPAPRIVVFQDLDDPPHGATFGEVMCTTYKTFGCAGLVTSGHARDIDQVAALEFPCFAAGVSPSHGYCRIVDLHVPVTVGGAIVKPGDLLHADVNGVTTIPFDIGREVAVGCQLLVDAEEVVLSYCRGGAADGVDGFRAAQQEQLRRFAEIAQEAKRIVADRRSE